MSDKNTPALSVTALAADSRPTSPVNDQRHAIPLHSRQTAMAPPANRNRDTTAIFPSAPTAVFDVCNRLVVSIFCEILNPNLK